MNRRPRFLPPKANQLRPDTLLHPVPDLTVEVLSDSATKTASA